MKTWSYSVTSHWFVLRWYLVFWKGRFFHTKSWRAWIMGKTVIACWHKSITTTGVTRRRLNVNQDPVTTAVEYTTWTRELFMSRVSDPSAILLLPRTKFSLVTFSHHWLYDSTHASKLTAANQVSCFYKSRWIRVCVYPLSGSSSKTTAIENKECIHVITWSRKRLSQFILRYRL